MWISRPLCFSHWQVMIPMWVRRTSVSTWSSSRKKQLALERLPFELIQTQTKTQVQHTLLSLGRINKEPRFQCNQLIWNGDGFFTTNYLFCRFKESSKSADEKWTEWNHTRVFWYTPFYSIVSFINSIFLFTTLVNVKLDSCAHTSLVHTRQRLKI